MNQEDKLSDALDRARRAKVITEEPLYQDALSAIRNECQAAWEATGSAETERREKIWLMLKVLNRFEGVMLAHLTDGKIAEDEIAFLDEQEKRRKVFGLF